VDPTKLVSHLSEFSVIFYAIYKNQQNCCTIGVTFLQLRPWKDWNVCNVVPMAAGRRGLANSGEAGGLGRAETGRGGSRGVLGLVWGLGPAETRPAMVLGGGGRRPALRGWFRRDGRLGGREGALVSCGRCQGTWRRHWSFKWSAGAGSSPRR
jgi:hypothetical protein